MDAKIFAGCRVVYSPGDEDAEQWWNHPISEWAKQVERQTGFTTSRVILHPGLDDPFLTSATYLNSAGLTFAAVELTDDGETLVAYLRLRRDGRRRVCEVGMLQDWLTGAVTVYPLRVLTDAMA